MRPKQGGPDRHHPYPLPRTNLFRPNRSSPPTPWEWNRDRSKSTRRSSLFDFDLWHYFSEYCPCLNSDPRAWTAETMRSRTPPSHFTTNLTTVLLSAHVPSGVEGSSECPVTRETFSLVGRRVSRFLPFLILDCNRRSGGTVERKRSRDSGLYTGPRSS